MCIELEKRINRHELDARAPVQHLARNACEDLLHHAIGAVVAILERLAEQKTAGVHQAIIDGPGIDADAIQGSRELPRFAQPGEGLIPQREDIPEAVPVQHHWLVGKAVHLFQAHLPAIEARQQHAPAAGTQIDCCNSACRHASSPFSARIRRRDAAIDVKDVAGALGGARRRSEERHRLGDILR